MANSKKHIIQKKTELKENEIWNKEKASLVKEFIIQESKKQSPERIIRNELLSIRFQMQDYIQKDKIEVEMQVLDFVKLYLKLLKKSQRDLASLFEMHDSNLYKYLIGERKLNIDIVMKLSSFSHTEPEIWYYIQTKNELNKLKQEKEKSNQYKKYDYKNLMPSY